MIFGRIKKYKHEIGNIYIAISYDLKFFYFVVETWKIHDRTAKKYSLSRTVK